MSKDLCYTYHMITDPTPYPHRVALEPGLLSVFRLILAVMLGLQVLMLLFIGFMAWSGDEPPPGLQVRAFLMLSILQPLALLLLLLFLFSSRVQQRLGQLYLPIAVGLFSVGAILQQYLFLWLVIVPARGGMIDDIELQGSLESDAWILLLTLLVPLVMVAWQYDFRRVFFFVLAITLFEAVVIGLWVPTNLPAWLFVEYGLKGTSNTIVAEPRLELPGNVDSLIFIFLPRIIILLVVGYIVTRMIGAQRQQRLALASANDKLRQHATTLEQLTVSQERNRLARELHDTLAHTLSAVSVQLEAVDSAWETNPPKARELLYKSLTQTRSGLTETRRALQALRASPLEDLGLALAVRTLAESTARRGGLALDIALDGEPLGLSADQEQQIYRIAQEALDNVLKHAHARKLRVTLRVGKDSITLTVADDGVGFVPNAAHGRGHFGVAGMRERAEAAGAILQIESQVGAGTTLLLTI